MSTYICEKCGCIDNTACGGNFWLRHLGRYKDDYANKHDLCAECTPEKEDEDDLDGVGMWHGKFPKQHWSEFGTPEELIAKSKGNTGNFVNAVRYFANIKKGESK